jgi:predicted ABC-type sugar transport system permease subunit
VAHETAAGSVRLETGGADEELEEPRNRILDTAERFWPWLFLLALIVIFSVTGRGFFDLFNFQSILANASIGLIMALGLTFVIIAGGIDCRSPMSWAWRRSFRRWS